MSSHKTQLNQMENKMNLSDSLSSLLEKALQPTRYGIKEIIDLKIGNWHALVLLDRKDQISGISTEGINAKDLSGHTPLETAYRLNRTELIEKLESLGALGDKEVINDKGSGQKTTNYEYTHLPAVHGKYKTLEKRYLEGENLNSRDDNGNTPLHLIAEHGHEKAAKFLSENHFRLGMAVYPKNNYGKTPRNLALSAGHQEIASHLITWEIESYIIKGRIRRDLDSGLLERLAKERKPGGVRVYDVSGC